MWLHRFSPKKGLPYHEWFIEFKKEPKSIHDFALEIDKNMRKQNNYYDDLISGSVLQPLVLTKLKPKTFIKFMKSVGKLGGKIKYNG